MATKQEIAALYVTLQAQTAQFKAALNEATAETRKFSAQMRTEMEEAKGSIALLGEQIGVVLPRHLRTFVAELPGVSAAMSAAFDAVAVIALIDVVVKAGEKVYEFARKNEEASRKNADANREFTASLVLSNAQLAISNDRLENDIAKLSHKPENSLKLALDEAKLSAIDLADKLEKATSKERELLDAENAGWFSRLTGTAGTASVKERLDRYQADYRAINETHDKQLESAKSLNDEQAIEADRQQKLLDLSKSYYNALDKELLLRQRYQELRSQYSETGMTDELFQLELQFRRSHSDGDQSAIIPALQQLRGQIGLGATNLSLQVHHDDLEKQDQALQAKKHSTDALEKLDADHLKKLQDTLRAREQMYGVDKAYEAAYWAFELDALHNGTKAYDEALQKLQESRMAVTGEFSKVRELAKKQVLGPTPDWGKPGGAFDERGADALSAANAKNAEVQAQLSAEWTLATDKLGRLTGAVTAHQAALDAQAIHTDEYRTKLKALQDQLADLKQDDALSGVLGMSKDNQAKEQSIQMQIDELTGRARIQALTDAQDVLSTTWKGMVDSVFDELIAKANDTQQQLKQIAVSVVDGLNTEMAKAVTGQHFDFSKVFLSGAQSLAKTAFQNVESIGFRALGVNKRDGSSESSALFVQIAGKDSGVPDGIASLFTSKRPNVVGPSGQSALAGKGILAMLNDSNWASSLFGGRLFGAGSIFGHALGGDVMAGVPTMTGELGPELFVPSVPGKIVPNNQLPGSGISIGHIDARGTDPALTQIAVQRAMAFTHARAVQDAARSMNDRQRRVAH